MFAFLARLFGKKSAPASPDRVPGPAQPDASVPHESPYETADVPADAAARHATRNPGGSGQPGEPLIPRLFPAIDSAARLVGEGDALQARHVLQQAMDHDPSARGREDVWAMLFDLDRLRGEREAFEVRAMAYAERFEKSPPSWDQPEMRQDGAPIRVELGPVLTVEARPQMEALTRSHLHSPMLRIDLSGVHDLDDAGCSLFVDYLARVRRYGGRYRLEAFDRVAAMLDDSIHPKCAELPGLWLLRMELWQSQGNRERFEAMALEYAEAFECSPPSWNDALDYSASLAQSAMSGQSRVFTLSGEIVGANAQTFAGLAAFADRPGHPVVDLARVRSMDLVSAQALSNVLDELSAKGKRARLQGVNALVGPLLQMTGVSRVAEITSRGLK